MKMLQLDPCIPVFVPSREMNGYAIGWIDYSQEHNLMWIIALDNSEIWVLENHLVRMQKNITVGRMENK